MSRRISSLKDLHELRGKFVKIAYRNFRRALVQSAEEAISELVTRRLTGRPGLFRRTGTLARGFRKRIYGSTVARLGVMIFTGVKYARIQQYGGTITPKRSQYLTIPIGANLTPAGVARYSARSVPNSFFVKTRGGKLLLMGGSKGRARPYFVLVKSVYIPPRLEFFQTVQSLRARRVQRLRRALEASLHGKEVA